MSPNAVEDFAKYLVSKNLIAGDLISKFDLPNAKTQDDPAAVGTHRPVGNDFADEVARFYGAPIAAELMEARPWSGDFPAVSCARSRFSRSGRRTAVPPRGRRSLRHGAVRAAEIVFGGAVRGESPRSRTSPPCSTSASRPTMRRPTTARGIERSNPTTTSRACAISPAARRWCARSTICSNARSSCAPATSTSSRSAPGSWCACASTACCARCRRRPACCRRR